MIRNFLKSAWRYSATNKTITAINLIGLTIGMTASLFIFLWVENELSYDSYHPEAQNIYRIKSYLALGKDNSWVWESSPYTLGEAIKEDIAEAEVVTRISNVVPVIKINGEFFTEKDAAYVDEHWFEVFHYDFIQGSAEAFNSGTYHAALTESGAKKYFGTEAALGKTLRIDTVDYIVQAVLKDYPANSSFRHDLLLPLAAKRADPRVVDTDNKWGSFDYRTFVKTTPSASASAVAKAIERIMDVNRENNNVTIGLTSLRDMRFEDDLQRASIQLGSRKTIGIFTALGALILIIACINYVNLTTARAMHRSKEVSIKKIVGANRVTLFLQFVCESLLFISVAISASILLVNVLMPVFNLLTENRFQFPFSSVGVWSLVGITVLISTIFISVYPAFLLSSFQPLTAVRGSSFLPIKGHQFRQILVVL